MPESEATRPAGTRPDRSAWLTEWSTLSVAGVENLVLVESLPSTNTLARRMVAAALDSGAPTRTLVVALEQSEGRGRADRRWASAAGLGVYASLILPLSTIESLQSLPLLAGVGLCRALGQWVKVGCRLKWPNDLLVDDRKIGGIRIDSVVRGDTGVAIVGFGVNWGQSSTDLPSSAATSLLLERQRGNAEELPGLAEITVALTAGLTTALAHCGDGAYAARAFAELSWARCGEPISFHVGRERLRGIFLGIDAKGLLRLDVGGEERRFAAGEVVEETSGHGGSRSVVR